MTERKKKYVCERERAAERISARPLLCHSLGGTFECVISGLKGRQTTSQEHTLTHAHAAVQSLIHWIYCQCGISHVIMLHVYTQSGYFNFLPFTKTLHRLTTVGK